MESCSDCFSCVGWGGEERLSQNPYMSLILNCESIFIDIAMKEVSRSMDCRLSCCFWRLHEPQASMCPFMAQENPLGFRWEHRPQVSMCPEAGARTKDTNMTSSSTRTMEVFWGCSMNHFHLRHPVVVHNQCYHPHSQHVPRQSLHELLTATYHHARPTPPGHALLCTAAFSRTCQRLLSLILPLFTRHTLLLSSLFPTSPLLICLPRWFFQLQCHTVYLFFLKELYMQILMAMNHLSVSRFLTSEV